MRDKDVDEKTTPSEFICRSSGAQHEAAARRGQNTLTQRRIDGQNDDYQCHNFVIWGLLEQEPRS